MRRAERESVPRRRAATRLDDGRMRVAEDRRAPRADVVEVAPAVGVPDVRPLAALEDERRATDGPEGPDRAVDAAREEPLGALDERRRPSSHGAPSAPSRRPEEAEDLVASGDGRRAGSGCR